jgi:hypothetical protein
MDRGRRRGRGWQAAGCWLRLHLGAGGGMSASGMRKFSLVGYSKTETENRRAMHNPSAHRFRHGRGRLIRAYARRQGKQGRANMDKRDPTRYRRNRRRARKPGTRKTEGGKLDAMDWRLGTGHWGLGDWSGREKWWSPAACLASVTLVLLALRTSSSAAPAFLARPAHRRLLLRHRVSLILLLASPVLQRSRAVGGAMNGCMSYGGAYGWTREKGECGELEALGACCQLELLPFTAANTLCKLPSCRGAAIASAK